MTPEILDKLQGGLESRALGFGKRSAWERSAARSAPASGSAQFTAWPVRAVATTVLRDIRASRDHRFNCSSFASACRTPIRTTPLFLKSGNTQMRIESPRSAHSRRGIKCKENNNDRMHLLRRCETVFAHLPPGGRGVLGGNAARGRYPSEAMRAVRPRTRGRRERR